MGAAKPKAGADDPDRQPLHGHGRTDQRARRPEEEAGYAEFFEAAEDPRKVEGELKLAAEREELEALGKPATKAAPAQEGFQSAAAVYGF